MWDEGVTRGTIQWCTLILHNRDRKRIACRGRPKFWSAAMLRRDSYEVKRGRDKKGERKKKER